MTAEPARPWADVPLDVDGVLSLEQHRAACRRGPGCVIGCEDSPLARRIRAANEEAVCCEQTASGGRMSVPTERQHSTSLNGVAMEQPGILNRIRALTAMISPARALEILNDQNFELQRAVSQKHVAYLASAIQEGELTELHLSFGELPDGTRRLVDGQHRLWAVVESNTGLPAVISIVHVANQAELGTLYAKYDRQSSRTPEQMLKAFGVYERSELSPTVVARIGRAAAIVGTGFSRSYHQQNRSVIQRTRMVERWLDAGAAYAAFLEGATQEVSGMLWRAPVAAVGLAVVRHQPEVAEAFWAVMAAESGLTRDDPRARLLAWLRANKVAGMGAIIYAKHVAGAWNAHFQGRTLERLLIRDRSGPVVLAGTPYGSGAAS